MSVEVFLFTHCLPSYYYSFLGLNVKLDVYSETNTLDDLVSFDSVLIAIQFTLSLFSGAFEMDLSVISSSILP